MGLFIKIAILIVFVAIMVVVGVYCRKKTSSVGDYVLGGRNLGPWITAFAYGTSYFSAVVFVGYSGQFGYSYGVATTWVGIGNALIGSLFAWVILGRRTRIMAKHFDSRTMPEFFESRYDSKALKIAASLIIFLFLVPYSASVYKGLSGLFTTAFGLGADAFKYVIIGMALLTAVYVIVGGYLAAAVNDFIQGIIMLVGIVAVVIAVLAGKGGFTEAISQLSQFEAQGIKGAYVSFFGPDPLGLLGVVILTSLGTWGLPQMVHKFYTIKSEKAVKTGTIISTLFAFVIAGGSYFMGAFGRLYVQDPKGNYDSIVPEMLSNIPDVLLGIVIVLVLSASMSTLSALVLSSSSTFVIDFLDKNIIKKGISGKKQVLLMRVFVAIFVILSVLLALDSNPRSMITALMSWSWGALAGSFLGPFIYGLFWKGTTKAGVWSSFITGVGITLVGFTIFFTGSNNAIFTGALKILNSPINIGAMTMLISLIIVPVVSLLTPKLSKEHVEKSFSCYNEKIVTEKKFALEETEE